MNYVKNLIKILLFVQCLLFCACSNKGGIPLEITTEDQKLRLSDFVKCPFNEEFKNNTNLEKYVLKKFGRPDEILKGRGSLGYGSNTGIIKNQITLRYYEKYSFIIYRGVSMKFELFSEIYIYTFEDLKYGINEKTTMRGIENLFGKPILDGQPEEVKNFRRKGSDAYRYTGSFLYYDHSKDDDFSYRYCLVFRFWEGELKTINVITNISYLKI